MFLYLIYMSHLVPSPLSLGASALPAFHLLQLASLLPFIQLHLFYFAHCHCRQPRGANDKGKKTHALSFLFCPCPQPFMSPRYPGGPRPSLRMPNQVWILVLFACLDDILVFQHDCHGYVMTTSDNSVTFPGSEKMKIHLQLMPKGKCHFPPINIWD